MDRDVRLVRPRDEHRRAVPGADRRQAERHVDLTAVESPLTVIPGLRELQISSF